MASKALKMIIAFESSALLRREQVKEIIKSVYKDVGK